MAAIRAGDTLVVAKLDRLARSLPNARDVAAELTSKGVMLNIGGSVYDPEDPFGRLLFNVLGMVAEFEADLIRMCTREGMALTKAKGRLRGKKPKLSAPQEKRLVSLHQGGEHATAEIAELFGVARSSGREGQSAGDRRPTASATTATTATTPGRTIDRTGCGRRTREQGRGLCDGGCFP